MGLKWQTYSVTDTINVIRNYCQPKMDIAKFVSDLRNIAPKIDCTNYNIKTPICNALNLQEL